MYDNSSFIGTKNKGKNVSLQVDKRTSAKWVIFKKEVTKVYLSIKTESGKKIKIYCLQYMNSIFQIAQKVISPFTAYEKALEDDSTV